MELQNLLSTALAIVSIATLAGLGLMRGTVSGLREQNGDLKERVAYLEKGRAEDHAHIAENAAENKMLKTMMTGKVEWVALTDQLEEHHRQALAWWLKTGQVLDDIRVALVDE